jgi:hypothetical protein
MRIEPIEGFEALPSKVAGGTALFYKGKEFAHFHHDEEIDLRLTRTWLGSNLSSPNESLWAGFAANDRDG